MITYQEEPVKVIFDEGADLINSHYEELPEDSHIEIDIDIEQYLALDHAGVLLVVTARDDGTLIGYTGYIVTPSLHCKNHIYAVSEALFLDKEYRKGSVGVDLLKVAEGFLKARGASLIIIASRSNTALDYLLPAMGYAHLENNYSKYIGGR